MLFFFGGVLFDGLVLALVLVLFVFSFCFVCYLFALFVVIFCFYVDRGEGGRGVQRAI